ncbi:SAM-dependent methyltransferase [Rheinheimera sp.]|uniref:SAM-dependent methyltransferase n=1 Tax=Rheinheimera sp. TaxID=1869214 RepID=UPI00307E979A
MTNKGSLVCVGTGMMMAAHITPLSQSYIQQADVVFALMSHGVVEKWLDSLHPDVRSLQPYYQEGQDRSQSYRQMVDAILTEVRAGKKVVGAFYGHPGVFAQVPHQALAQARAEGFAAHMEPGVSAEDCLIADLGIDPGRVGCQQYETTQLMMFKRNIDPSAYLILWQIGVAGDLSVARFSTNQQRLALLVELLSEQYPVDHQVVLYEACTLPVGKPRMDRIRLGDLPQAELFLHTTLVIPPAKKLVPNMAMRQLLDPAAD